MEIPSALERQSVGPIIGSFSLEGVQDVATSSLISRTYSAGGASGPVTYIPLLVARTFVAQTLFIIQGSTFAAANVDFGVCDKLGNRLAHTGPSALNNATDTIQSFPLALNLKPDLYYLASWFGGATATIWGGSCLTDARNLGCFEVATQTQVPATASLSYSNVPGNQVIPGIWLTSRSFV